MMTKPPEQIWAVYAEGSKTSDGVPEPFAACVQKELIALEERHGSPVFPYIREDVHQARIAELEVKLAKARDNALEDAARVAEEFNEDCWEYSTGNRARVVGMRDDVATAILALKGEQNNED